MPDHSLSFIDLEEGVDYAVVLRPLASPLRPLQARLMRGRPEDCLRVFDAGAVWQPGGFVHESGGWSDHNEEHARERYLLLGRWDERADGDLDMTWQGLAKHAYGEVLRQRALVRRLAKLGIVREPEPYVLGPDSPNAIDRSVLLNYDELDLLLRAAGV